MKTASILGFYGMSIGKQLLTFQRIIVPSSSELTVQNKHLSTFLTIPNPEDGSTMILQNICNCLPINIA